MNQLKKKIRSKFQKVIPSFIEGRFLRKTGGLIKRMYDKFIASIDRRLGIIAKYFLSISTEVDENKIMFITFQGDYTCNPKYITEELLKRNVDWDIVWSGRKYTLTHADDIHADRIRFVEQYTTEFYKELASAKIWVVNSVDFLKNPIYKKKEQILIETWHGSLGIKRFDKNSNSGRRWVSAAELCGRIAAYCISNSTFENEVYRGTYWPKTPILEYGHPRNDILAPSRTEMQELAKNRVFAKYEVEPDTKIVLYAPTFRDSKTFSCYNIRYDELIDTLQERFGGNWKVFVRFHPTVRKYAKGMLKKNTNVVDVTDYPDIQEIMAVSDVAITDYSSWIYDFILLRRPGFIFATDIEEYNDERGFYFKLESTPFPIATSNEELQNNILSFDNETYVERVEAFISEKGCVDDGHASERVADKLEELMNAKKADM